MPLLRLTKSSAWRSHGMAKSVMLYRVVRPNHWRILSRDGAKSETYIISEFVLWYVPKIGKCMNFMFRSLCLNMHWSRCGVGASGLFWYYIPPTHIQKREKKMTGKKEENDWNVPWPKFLDPRKFYKSSQTTNFTYNCSQHLLIDMFCEIFHSQISYQDSIPEISPSSL